MLGEALTLKKSRCRGFGNMTPAILPFWYLMRLLQPGLAFFTNDSVGPGHILVWLGVTESECFWGMDRESEFGAHR
jgi:hypothetical protein